MSETYSAIDIMRMPDPWQVETLESPSRYILRNCARQVGKTTVAAAAALKCAMEGSDVMVVVPIRRNSSELERAVARGVKTEDGPGPRWEKGLFTVGTGRVTIWPRHTEPHGPVDLIVIDDAAHVGVLDIVRAHWFLRPGGKVIALSTPAGRGGWFFEACRAAASWGWDYREVTGSMCPRITQHHLDGEREDMTRAQFEAEYLCQFVAA